MSYIIRMAGTGWIDGVYRGPKSAAQALETWRRRVPRATFVLLEITDIPDTIHDKEQYLPDLWHTGSLSRRPTPPFTTMH